MNDETTVICREVTMVYGAEARAKGRRVETSRDVAVFARELLGKRLQESFLVVALDSRHRPIGWTEVGRGGMSACPVAPADVFRFLLVSGATGAILIHNHPSGDVSPSSEDRELIGRLVDAGALLGIRVVDSLIVSDAAHFSFLDGGILR